MNSEKTVGQVCNLPCFEGFGRLKTCPTSIALLLVFATPLASQIDPPWVGKHLVMTRSGVQMKATGPNGRKYVIGKPLGLVKVGQQFVVLPQRHARLEVYRKQHPYPEGMVLTAYTPQLPAEPSAATVPALPPPSVRPAEVETPVLQPVAAIAAQPSDVQRLQGTWICILTLKDGEAVEDFVGVRAVIDGDNLNWFFPKGDGTYAEMKKKFRIDPAQNPKDFDSWIAAKPASVEMRIYSLSGNTLRMATNLDQKTRPASFDAARWQFTMTRLVEDADRPGVPPLPPPGVR